MNYLKVAANLEAFELPNICGNCGVYAIILVGPKKEQFSNTNYSNRLFTKKKKNYSNRLNKNKLKKNKKGLLVGVDDETVCTHTHTNFHNVTPISHVLKIHSMK